MTVGSLLVDFDGTICATNVANELRRRFAPEGWQDYDELAQGGRITPRDAISHQTRLLALGGVWRIRRGKRFER